jgi:hypothetical protein
MENCVYKIKLEGKLLDIYTKECSCKWFYEHLANYPFCKKLSIKYREKYMKLHIIFLRMAFVLFPKLRDYYETGYTLCIDNNTGYINILKKSKNEQRN